MIRSYAPKDKEKLVNLLRLNTPTYFDSSEETDYIDYLNNHSDNYFLIEEDNVILGAGGFNFSEDKKSARISWDLVHPDAQGRGLGSMLTKFRIDKIKEHPEVELISVRTSQLVYKFYKKLGFELKEIVKDYWAKGFDLYRMELKE
jgi:ribosomal-protein-alanine N-acetyltransferase